MNDTTDYFNLFLCFAPLACLVAASIYFDCKYAVEENGKVKKRNKSKTKKSNGNLETNTKL